MTHCVTVGHVIRTFADKEAEKIWQGTPSRRLPTDIQHAARRKLRMLNNATTLDDPRVPPANRLEALKGDRKGQHGIRINNQWRICFHWKEGDALDVVIVDYH
jgi:proteic killer suppression protein